MFKPQARYAWLRELPSSAALMREIEASVRGGAVSQATSANYILHWSAFLLWLADDLQIAVDSAAALDSGVTACTAAEVNRYLTVLVVERKRTIPTVRTTAASLRAAFRLLKPLLSLEIDPDEIKSPSILETPVLTLPAFEAWSDTQTPGNALAQRRTGVRKFFTYVKDARAIEFDAEAERAALDSAVAEAAAQRLLTPEWAHAGTLTGVLLLDAKKLFDEYAATMLENADINGLLSSIRSFYRWAVTSGFIKLDIDYELINPANVKMTRGRRRISLEGGRTLEKIEPVRTPRPPRTPRAKPRVMELRERTGPRPEPAGTTRTERDLPPPPLPPPPKVVRVVRRVSFGDGRIKNVIYPRNAVVDELIMRGIRE